MKINLGPYELAFRRDRHPRGSWFVSVTLTYYRFWRRHATH